MWECIDVGLFMHLAWHSERKKVRSKDNCTLWSMNFSSGPALVKLSRIYPKFKEIDD